MAFQFLDRSIRLPSSSAEVAQRLSGIHHEWLMTDAERGTLHALLTTLKPQCAIEVGVYKAGSLAILSALSQKVYALDIDPACEAAYASRFPNVDSSPDHRKIPCRS